MSKNCIITTVKSKIKGNATSYIEKENEIFIPTSKKFSLVQTRVIAQDKVNKINKEYLSEKFGAVVSLNTSYTDGTGINIHPSQRLVEAYEVKEGNKTIEEVNRLDFFNGDVILYEQELKDFENEANLMRFSDLRQELRVQEGKLNFKNGKISDFEILSENSVIDKEISQQQAKIIFNKKNRNNQEKKDLSIYFANYFLNSVYDKEGLLHLGYTRFLRYGITPPKLLIVKDNERKNPFFQYNNVVIIGLKQLEKFINSLKTPSFEKFENLINTVAQEEIIHLYADYLLDYQDIDNIYNEMTEKDINQIKKIYGNSSIQKENIVHEYVRMVVQQRVFGKTTEYETFTLSNAIMSFFGNLLEELNDFLNRIIGSTNTQKAIEDVINFTKGNFSKELDKKIINRVFNKGQILEANLNVLNNFQEEQKELDKIVDKINNESRQFESFQNIITNEQKPTSIDTTKSDGLLFGNLQDLAKSNKIAVGEIKVENKKIVGFDKKPNPYLRDYNTDLTEVQAKKLFEKSSKSIKDYERLAVYFANMFVNEIIDKDVHLKMGYMRLAEYSQQKPKILITDTNKKTNPFYQYNNTIIIGIYQLQQLLENGNYSDYQKFQNLIQSVAQEESIHLFAEYLFNKETVDNIYSEMSEKDIQKIKDIYENENLDKNGIVHEYVRMVVQQHVFDSTTEQEKVKLTNSVLDFISKMINEIQQFLSEIIGQNNTKQAIQDVISFTKGNFSKELDKKIINRVFEKGKILESNLEQLNQKKENLITDSNQAVNQVINPGKQGKLFQESENTSFQQFQQSLNKPNTNPILQGNQEAVITPNDKIIWGHPAIGKSYAAKKVKMIDFDSYKLGINKKYNLYIAPGLSDTELRTDDKTREARENWRYESEENQALWNQFIRDVWQQAKKDAKEQGAILFASDLLVLREFGNEVDKALTMPDELFFERSKQRNNFIEGELGTKVWKGNLNRAVNNFKEKFGEDKVISTEKYLSDLFITPQQEQVKKFAELQERLNNKEFLEGTKNAFESSEELQQFGTQEQYNDYIARVSLGIIKNPSSGEYNYESQVKDIVYHGTRFNIKNKKFDIKKAGSATFGFSGAGFFTNNKEWAEERFAYNDSMDDGTQEGNFVFSAILDIKSPTKLDTVFDFNKSIEEGFIENVRQSINRKISKEVPMGRFFSQGGAHNNQKQAIVIFNRKTYDYTVNYIDGSKTEDKEINLFGKKSIHQVPKSITKKEFEDSLNEKGKEIYTKGINNINDFFNERSEDIKKAIDLENSNVKTSTIVKDSDSVISKQSDGETLEYAVFKSEQIHILGSKQDIENFAKFVKNNESGNTKDMENYMSSKSVDYIMDKLIQSGKIEKRC